MFEDDINTSIEEHYSSDFLFDRGIEFIERQIVKDRHFAMVLSITDPHGEFNLFYIRCNIYHVF